MPRLRTDRKKYRKGLVPRNYDFLGPFNEPMIGPGRNVADEAARLHDIEYGQIGVRAYFMHNDADQAFIEATKDAEGLGAIAHNLFRIKRAIAPRMSKRLRDEDTVHESERVRKAPSIEPKDPEQKKISGSTDAPVESVGIARSMAPSGGTAGTLGSGETAIDIQKPHYGLPTTNTVILPWTGYCTPVTFDDNKMVSIGLRMNSPYDCFLRSLDTPTAGSALSEGVFTTQPGSTTATWPNPAYLYPTTIGSGTNTTESPMWRGFWDKCYNKYSVLGCEYNITIYNPKERRGDDVLVAWGTDAYSAAGVGREFPQERNSHEMEFWPGLQWAVAAGQSDGTDDDCYVTINGFYRPGDTERNVQNDEDVKTWTTVGSNPSLTERLMIFFGRGAFNNYTGKLACKVRIQLRYYVQLKDISPNFMFPHSGQTAFALNVPTDILKLV